MRRLLTLVGTLVICFGLGAFASMFLICVPIALMTVVGELFWLHSTVLLIEMVIMWIMYLLFQHNLFLTISRAINTYRTSQWTGR